MPSQPAPKGPRSRGPVDAFAQRLEASLVQRIELGRYDVWFRPHTKFILRDGQLTVGVPNLFSQEWLEKTFGEAVREAAAEVLGKPVPVRFAIDPELFQEARAEQEKARNAERRTKDAPKSAMRMQQIYLVIVLPRLSTTVSALLNPKATNQLRSSAFRAPRSARIANGARSATSSSAAAIGSPMPPRLASSKSRDRGRIRSFSTALSVPARRTCWKGYTRGCAVTFPRRA